MRVLPALAQLLGLDRGAWTRRRYDAQQVKQYLRTRHGHRGGPATREGDGDSERIRRVLETVPSLVREPHVQRRYRGFDRYLDVLPKILSQYLHGKEASEIASGLQFLATAYGVEAVLDITAQLVAERLSVVPR